MAAGDPGWPAAPLGRPGWRGRYGYPAGCGPVGVARARRRVEPTRAATCAPGWRPVRAAARRTDLLTLPGARFFLPIPPPVRIISNYDKDPGLPCRFLRFIIEPHTGLNGSGNANAYASGHPRSRPDGLMARSTGSPCWQTRERGRAARPLGADAAGRLVLTCRRTSGTCSPRSTSPSEGPSRQLNVGPAVRQAGET